MGNRVATLVVGCCILAGACSVSTPRHETALNTDGSLRTAAADGTITETPAPGQGVAADAVTESSVEGLPAGSGTAGTARRAAPGGAPTTGAARAGAAAPRGGAAAGKPVTGVTKDTVTISIIAGFSGPLAPMVTKAYEAMQTWQEDVNDAGGIHGRKVVLKPVDHKETADGGVAACKEALSNGSFFAAVPEGQDANVTAISCLDAAGMPTLYYAAAEDPAWERGFADSLTSQQGGLLLARFIKGHHKGAAMKVGLIYVNQAAYKAVADGMLPEAKKIGLDVAAVESVEPNQASFTSQLLRMQQAGVQILVISATTEAIGIMRDVRSMGWQPQVTGWGYLFDFVTAAGRGLFDGVTGLRAYATVDSPKYPAYAKRMAARGRNRDDRTTDLEGFPTYARAQVIGEFIRRAGASPTRESLVVGAEGMKAYDNAILAPLTYGPGAHVGASAAFGAVCCNEDNTWKGLGPAKSSW